MKNMYRIGFLSFVLLFAVASGGFAQKLAHLKSSDIIALLAKRDSVEPKLVKLQTELQTESQNMEVEYNRKADDYQTNQTKWTDLVKKSKEAELMQIQQRITDYRAAASDELTNKQQELLQPIYDEVLKAISEVAKTQGITYVINTDALLYVATEAVDLGPAVKTKLGLK